MYIYIYISVHILLLVGPLTYPDRQIYVQYCNYMSVDDSSFIRSLKMLIIVIIYVYYIITGLFVQHMIQVSLIQYEFICQDIVCQDIHYILPYQVTLSMETIRV